jgi:hypothetical protein
MRGVAHPAGPHESVEAPGDASSLSAVALAVVGHGPGRSAGLVVPTACMPCCWPVQARLSCRAARHGYSGPPSSRHVWCLSRHATASAHMTVILLATGYWASVGQRPPCLRDTKLPCKRGQTTLAFPGGRVSQISGDTTLVLCQGGTHGNAPLILLSSIAVCSGILETER